MAFETLTVSKEGTVLFVEIAAPPMNLLGPALVRDLVSLIQQAEADNEANNNDESTRQEEWIDQTGSSE